MTLAKPSENDDLAKESFNHQSSSVLITGGSGLIGSRLVVELLELKYQVSILTRSREKTRALYRGRNLNADIAIVDTLDPAIDYQVIINLAGKPLDSERWNEKVKQQIIESRVETTKKVVDYIEQTKQKPSLLISGSAIGFYGSRGSEILHESDPGSAGFSNSLCSQWEDQALAASASGVRVVLLRTGIVLSTKGGALAAMLPAFKFFAGGPLGTGKQWMSWIHIDDLAAMIIWIIQNEQLSGPVNAVAPTPVINQEFAQVLASVINRPAHLRMPQMLAKMIFGEMAEELLLSGQRVMPEIALSSGFNFKYPTLGTALENLLVLK